ncbi:MULTISPECIES: MliC family protein [Moraxella]|uniref:C-type lysozyme inhibitor domain-containing protein n=1 Tax=Moraxella catarrhalis TaxID=480 RepID=A0A7Z1A4N6_MORCA|nr:MliC family protein [Moraxella catarrhalis]OAV01714.1 hypothetical protein AO382_0080 [Moraxella catarrhalis]STY82343.1 Membrane-bound lysozyme-inhibitor of c-type lysozyme [Moraxella catarrhalis]
MKKLLLSSAAVMMAITGCTTPSTVSVPANQAGVVVVPTAGTHHGAHHHGTHHQHGVYGQDITAVYQCDEGAKVVANYQPENDRAVLTVSAPTWHLHNQEIVMRPATRGSGMRFINDTNPNSVYDWHAQRSEALLSVILGETGQEYTLNCRTNSPALM